VVFVKVWRPRRSWRIADEAPSAGKAKLAYSAGQIFRAWAPFLLLSIFVAAWGIKPLKETLDSWSLLKFKIPLLHNAVLVGDKLVPKAAEFKWNVLSAAGTAILVAGLLSIRLMGASFVTGLKVFGTTLKQLKWPIVAVSAILGFAYLMNFSGMATTLGYAFATTGKAFPFFAPLLGWLGVFMTGSDTSANALFGKLQEVSATKIGVDPVITVAANTCGGVCGKMISPQSLSVACAATNQVGKESDIFRFTLKHSIILALVIACIVYRSRPSSPSSCRCTPRARPPRSRRRRTSASA